MDREVTITIHVRPSIQASNAKFSDVLPRSSAIFVYAAVKGYSGGGWIGSETDYVNVTVEYRVGDTWYPVGSVASSGGFADNSDKLASSPENWKIPISANEVRITVVYRMKGPTNIFSSTCFRDFFGLTNCGSGSGSSRNVRLAFYVELIPSEYLS